MKFIAYLLLATCAFAQTAVPDLAQLKVAAERGNAVAQYEYAVKIGLSNSTDSFAMALKSAQQGYGPAEDMVGNHYASRYAFSGKDRPTFERLAVRYTSRAAFKGIPAAQARLSGFYERGVAVPKDLGLAYGWAAVALKQAGGPKQLPALTYKVGLDQLIARVSTADIARGQQFANDFRVGADNFVEIDMLARQMKLSAMFEKDGRKMVVVNQTRIAEGETKGLMIDGETVNVTCTKIEGKTATFRLGRYDFKLSGR